MAINRETDYREFLADISFNFAAVDSSLIYEGLFSPENNLIVIIQNFYVWVTSSIGLLLLVPFYTVRPGSVLL